MSWPGPGSCHRKRKRLRIRSGRAFHPRRHVFALGNQDRHRPRVFDVAHQLRRLPKHLLEVVLEVFGRAFDRPFLLRALHNRHRAADGRPRALRPCGLTTNHDHRSGCHDRNRNPHPAQTPDTCTLIHLTSPCAADWIPTPRNIGIASGLGGGRIRRRAQSRLATEDLGNTKRARMGFLRGPNYTQTGRWVDSTAPHGFAGCLQAALRPLLEQFREG